MCNMCFTQVQSLAPHGSLSIAEYSPAYPELPESVPGILSSTGSRQHCSLWLLPWNSHQISQNHQCPQPVKHHFLPQNRLFNVQVKKKQTVMSLHETEFHTLILSSHHWGENPVCLLHFPIDKIEIYLPCVANRLKQAKVLRVISLFLYSMAWFQEYILSTSFL